MTTSENKNSYKKRYVNRGKDESIQSERLAFTGRIAASIAHEIRNPLGNVFMAVQQLRNAFAEDSPWAKHIEVIIRNTERVNFLITELLNSARPPELDIQPHDIHDILENILDSIKAKIRAQKIEVIKGYSPQPPQINVDAEQIERALSNVMLNAVDAMPDGGVMTVTTKLEEDSLVVTIQDTGEGIPEEDIIRIFDPFFSTKPSGVGLGLATTYGIVVGHGGTIDVESKENEGAFFVISLPAK